MPNLDCDQMTSGDPNFFMIFILVGLKEACMSNFSCIGCLEVAVLWFEKQPIKAAILNVKTPI